ncbi:hypothetical protein [Pseudoalteromonas aurantia]|uniref:hypothetical protein n=1 Tax=Pseudoalteromonas aurantia TaxID=43654 RepID=UPI00110BEFD0|nr:hypothetical protein [Pseudoalteromonas aurantia]
MNLLFFTICSTLSPLTQSTKPDLLLFRLRKVPFVLSAMHIERLLSNHELLRESTSVYVTLSRFVVTEKHPIILVDWSHADTQNKHCILRASIVSEGRSVTLYQKSTFGYQYHCPKVQKDTIFSKKSSNYMV